MIKSAIGHQPTLVTCSFPAARLVDAAPEAITSRSPNGTPQGRAHTARRHSGQLRRGARLETVLREPSQPSIHLFHRPRGPQEVVHLLLGALAQVELLAKSLLSPVAMPSLLPSTLRNTRTKLSIMRSSAASSLAVGESNSPRRAALSKSVRARGAAALEIFICSSACRRAQSLCGMCFISQGFQPFVAGFTSATLIPKAPRHCPGPFSLARRIRALVLDRHQRVVQPGQADARLIHPVDGEQRRVVGQRKLHHPVV